MEWIPFFHLTVRWRELVFLFSMNWYQSLNFFQPECPHRGTAERNIAFRRRYLSEASHGVSGQCCYLVGCCVCLLSGRLLSFQILSPREEETVEARGKFFFQWLATRLPLVAFGEMNIVAACIGLAFPRKNRATNVYTAGLQEERQESPQWPPAGWKDTDSCGCSSHKGNCRTRVSKETEPD